MLDNITLALTVLFSSWASYVAGMELFSSLKQLYLKSQLSQMKLALHKMFVQVEKTPNHSRGLEALIISNEEDLADKIRVRQNVVRNKLREALSYIGLSVACATLVAMLF